MLLLLLGILHRLPAISERDLALTRKLQQGLGKGSRLAFFQEIWFLGKTPLALIVLAGLSAARWQQGWIYWIGFGLIVGIERAIKITFQRKRPYQQSHTIMMLQPKLPTDPSFPSGDCLRIWYLALILPAFAGNPGYLLLAMILLAVLVSLGRMVMGVHYVTDVISGTGLGLLGAGTTLWAWQVLSGM